MLEKRNGLMRHPASAIVALGAAGTLAVLGLNNIDKAHSTQSEATAIIKDIREGKVEALPTEGTLALRPGTVLRKSPSMRYADGQTNEAGNGEKPIPDGKVVLAVDPIQVNDNLGNTWFGFTLDGKPTEGTDDKTMGSHYRWVNLSALQGKKSPDGQPFFI